jgi:hypothetical protein
MYFPDLPHTCSRRLRLASKVPQRLYEVELGLRFQPRLSSAPALVSVVGLDHRRIIAKPLAISGCVSAWLLCALCAFSVYLIIRAHAYAGVM